MMSELSIHRAGDRSLLLDVPEERVVGLAGRLRAEPFSARLEAVIPAAATILVTATHADALPRLRSAIQELITSLDADAGEREQPARTVPIPVIYDGPDLEDVARRCGLTPREVVAEHTGTEHQVGFFGFAPGFAYLNGLSAALHLPRRDSPRTNIEAGFVAIAANQSVVYPGGSPGGWHLIGRTNLRLWDLTRDPPAKLKVGDRVTFIAQGGVT
jgi:KipI family sensor histidine kinase inhibitor